MLIHINLSLFSASCGSEKACSSPDVIPIFGTKEGAGTFRPIETFSTHLINMLFTIYIFLPSQCLFLIFFHNIPSNITDDTQSLSVSHLSGALLILFIPWMKLLNVFFSGVHLSVRGSSILGGVNTNHSIRGNLSFTYNIIECVLLRCTFVCQRRQYSGWSKYKSFYQRQLVLYI